MYTSNTFGNDTKGEGSGMYNNYSSPVLTNVIFSGNRSHKFGGGIFNYSSSPILTNVTIAGNSANNSGGGIHNTSGSSPKIRNSIIYRNTDGISGDASVITYSLVQGVTIENDGNNNISGDKDPLFINQGTLGFGDGNYRIRNNSPAYNSGNNAYYNAGSVPYLSLL